MADGAVRGAGASQDVAEPPADPAIARRQRWLAVLAKADRGALERAFAALAEPPPLAPLRPPETGLVMVRGRVGGTGQRFNLGEMTVTRCAVQTAAGVIGHGYVAGRDQRHAELAACFDALLQDPARGPALLAGVIEPLAAAQAAARAQDARQAAATRVEFFTLARGEG